MFQELRLLRAPQLTPWGDVNGTGCLDQRRDERRSTSTITNAKQFEDFVFANPRYGSPLWTQFLRGLSRTARSDLPDDQCVLTHGDIRPANIIVQRNDDGTLAVNGIIDWECSGWYPPYWEAVKMTNCLDVHETSDWYLYLPESIAPSTYANRWLIDRLWGSQVE